jgi:signal transduction histidine kinase
VASVIAIVLAALAGWVASRDVTQPVLALTHATRRMEQGDLAMRATLPNAKQANEFRTLADSFNNMAQRVEDTVSTLRAFVSDAAHELNTPLTALKTNLELAANETDTTQKGIFLARALEQNRRLELLTSSLLDLSRIEAAQATPDPEPVNLRRLAAEAGERFASRAEQAERSFGLSLPESDVTLTGNSLHLQRALDNLLENALKFTPQGGTIALALEQKDGQAILTVTDNGIGILPEDLPHLFERFHRGRNSAEYPGNGLGLAIVKAIVSAHGGQVSVESAGRGQGSRFTITLGN